MLVQKHFAATQLLCIDMQVWNLQFSTNLTQPDLCCFFLTYDVTFVYSNI